MKSTILLMALFTAFPMGVSVVQSKESRRIEAANDVLRDLAAMAEQAIPGYLLRDAEGVAIVPEVFRGAFVVGGPWGQGLVLVRTPPGPWSAPGFITLTGGILGWQTGVQSTDLVLIFKARRSVESLQRGKLILGVDAAAAAGPVGRDAQASTDRQSKSEILAYSRGRGFCAGVAIDGADLRIDDAANERFYNVKNISGSQIFGGQLPSEPPTASQLRQALENLTQAR